MATLSLDRRPGFLAPAGSFFALYSTVTTPGNCMSTIKPAGKKVRYAVVGAGWFGQAAVLPAFAHATDNSELVAIVSGDAEKRAELGKKYGVPAVPYEEYRPLMAAGKLDAVYIVTPNSEHREHTLAAAEHGVHVLCEKPLADTAAAAEEMIEACDRNRVHLMTAYRLHFEKMNLSAVDLLQKGTIGEPKLISAVNTQRVEDGNTRLDPNLGGHPLLDIGIYCVNACRYLFRAEPTEVTGFATVLTDPKFGRVPDMVAAVLKFPNDRLAQIACGFGEAKVSMCQVVGTTGDIRMDPAFGFVGERVLRLMTKDAKEPSKTRFPQTDHVAPEIVYFSDCILNNKPPEPDGHEGLIDLRILEAIQRSAETGAAVKVPSTPRKPRPDMTQQIDRPAVKEPKLVNAASPTGE